MKQKPQIIYIHGGMTFKSKKDHIHFLQTRDISLGKRTPNWSDDDFDAKLGGKYEITRPRMPLSDNALYSDWKIAFERYIPLLRDGVILIGESLGGIFLAQYLSENKFPKRISAVFLVCAPFDGSLSSEDLVGGFKLKSDLAKLDRSTENLVLMFSKDDDVVPVEHAEKYRAKLPNAKILIYKSKNGHFNITKFPEIVNMIKKLK
jgi:predicted alpha/beta hydrolase family esterase